MGAYKHTVANSYDNGSLFLSDLWIYPRVNPTINILVIHIGSFHASYPDIVCNHTLATIRYTPIHNKSDAINIV